MNSIFSQETETLETEPPPTETLQTEPLQTEPLQTEPQQNATLTRFSKLDSITPYVGALKSIRKYYFEDLSTETNIYNKQSAINNQLLVEWKDSRWLVLSSAIFGVPAIYGFQKHAVFHSTLLLITSLVSMGYWVCAKHSWRRNLDICLAKTTAFIFMVSGIYKINTVYVCMFYPVCLTLLYMYYLSAKYYQQNPLWICYHFIFHVLLSMGAYLIFLHM
jgi:hypothetical protein